MSLSNYPPGVTDSMFDEPPCLCGDGDCQCMCPHGQTPATYPAESLADVGIAPDGCVIVCRCSEMCVCEPEDFEEAE